VADIIGAERYDERRARLRASLATTDADAILITKLVNVRYLTGFSGSNAALLVTADDAVFCTDGRYATQASAEVAGIEHVIYRFCDEALVERGVKAGLRRLAVEEHHLTAERHRRLLELDETSGLGFVALGHAVEALREVKDEAEIALLREACAIGDRAFAELIDSILLGRGERQIALELERRMVEHGADGVAFPTIVASGPNSAIPHHQPTDRRVADGEFLKLDFGARYQGYHSDMTRTVVVGRRPAEWQVELYDLVFAAQKAGRQALRPGAGLGEVDEAARHVIVDAGYGERFNHGLGHGVGLEIHEDPFFRAGADGRLSDRMSVTVEPGVYLPGRGGVRIEDTLVVHDVADGGPDLLTMTTKEMLVL
jgi:Xaa-Pro aminopeptidase